MLIGSELVIECRSEDGEDILFRVDQNGALLYNAKFDIIAKGKDGRENHIALNPDIGIAIGKNPVYEANADGFCVFNEDNAVFYVDIDTGDIVAKGNIYAKGFYLKKGNGYVNALASSTTKVSDKSIDGAVVNPKGLYVENYNGTKSFEVTDDAETIIRNSTITLFSGENEENAKNKLTIDPTDFIRWTMNGEPKFYYDPDIVVTKKGNKTETGALVFRGLLKTDSLSVISGDNKDAWLRIDSSGITGDRVKFDAGSRVIDMRCGSLMVNGDSVATTDITNSLGDKIDVIESDIRILKDKIAALSSPAPPIG